MMETWIAWSRHSFLPYTKSFGISIHPLYARSPGKWKKRKKVSVKNLCNVFSVVPVQRTLRHQVAAIKNFELFMTPGNLPIPCAKSAITYM